MRGTICPSLVSAMAWSPPSRNTPSLTSSKQSSSYNVHSTSNTKSRDHVRPPTQGVPYGLPTHVLSDFGKECVTLMIEALRDERAKFRKYFTNHFKYTHKTLVCSICFLEETNSYIARLQWIEKIPKYGPKEMKTRTRSKDKLEVIGYEETQQEEDSIPVYRAWIEEQFGSKMLQQVVSMRHDCHHSWVKAP